MNRKKATDNQPKVRRKKYAISKMYKKIAGALVLAVVLIIGVGATTVSHLRPFNTDVTSRQITDDSNIKNVKNQYDSANKIMVSQFFIGNLKQVDDVSDDSNLDNVFYQIETHERKNPDHKLTTQVKKINDHYLILVTKNVEKDYNALSYTFKIKKLDRHLDTPISSNEPPKFYIKQTRTPIKKYIDLSDPMNFNNDYNKFLKQNFQKKIKQAKEKITTNKDVIESDQKSILNLENKKITAVDEDRDKFQKQIDDKKDDIDIQKQQTRSQEKIISNYHKRIKKIQESY